jgi:hypothetical protein
MVSGQVGQMDGKRAGGVDARQPGQWGRMEGRQESRANIRQAGHWGRWKEGRKVGQMPILDLKRKAD